MQQCYRNDAGAWLGFGLLILRVDERWFVLMLWLSCFAFLLHTAERDSAASYEVGSCRVVNLLVFKVVVCRNVFFLVLCVVGFVR